MTGFRLSAILSLIIITGIFQHLPGQTVSIYPASGLYKSSVDVQLTTTDNASIRYTLDGSNPDLSSPVYKSPIRIDKSSVLKTQGNKADGNPGPISCASYLMGRHQSLPIISIITDPKHLWNESIGIYVKGPNANSDFPYSGANFWEDWEVPVFIEMFEPDGKIAFAQNAGAKIFGGFSRVYLQKSLSIHTRRSYGKPDVKYRIFPDSPLDEYSRFVLRNSGNDWNHSMLRDGVMTYLFHPSIDQQAFRPSVVYINGVYWGIHNLREKINEEYIESHYGIKENAISILEKNAITIHGNNTDYLTLLEFVEDNDLSIKENYDHVSTKIDVKNFIYYQIANIFIDNRDWPASNIKFWKQNSEEGKWRWISFDRDFAFAYHGIENVNFNTLEFAMESEGPNWPNPPWSTLLFRSLMRNETFRSKFLNTFADELNTRWKTENVQNVIEYLTLKIEQEIHHHLDRWDGSLNFWRKNISDMHSFAKDRPQIMFGQIQSTFDIPASHTITLNTNNPKFGAIKVNEIEPEGFPWTGRYFQGIPITLTAMPEPGYKFIKWEGDVNTSDYIIDVDLHDNTSITAEFELVDPDLSSIIINEIYYKSNDSKIRDWVELYNRGVSEVNISNWMFKDEKHTKGFKIPANTSLKPGEYLVLCRDRDNFHSIYGNSISTLGNFDFGLSSFGECVTIMDDTGNIADVVCYRSTYPWPETNDKASIALKSPEIFNSHAGNWFAKYKNGSPGAFNSPNEVSALDVLIFPNPAKDFIEAEFSGKLSSLVLVTIHSQHGVIISSKIIDAKNMSSIRIEFESPLRAGLYILGVASENSVITRKFIIRK